MTTGLKQRKLHVPRVLVALLMATAFLVMASIFAPLPSDADDVLFTPSTPLPSTDPHHGLPCIGTLEDRMYHVRAFATDGGPRYSIYDVQGEELAVLMSAERVAEMFPELQLPDLDFSAPSQIMMVEPNNNNW
jgi:hypothetical protein